MDGGSLSFDEAVAALQGACKFGIHPSLDGIRALTDALGRPQDAYSVVQVTGTNGKSSVTRMTSALLAAEGLDTAAYTSPHLESYAERIEFGGHPCSPDEFGSAIGAALEAARAAGRADGDLTEFELLTAGALWLFRERGIDVACLEVGMGGRWDATSVTAPAVAVITGVGLDHTERLGETVEAIAFDKAHIIKPGASVVLGPGTIEVADVFLDRAASFGLHPRFVAHGADRSPVAEEATARFRVTGAPDRPGGTLRLDVEGIHSAYRELEVTAPSYQAANVAVSIAAAECALGRGLRPDAARAALRGMRFPGRFELVAAGPLVVLDGAHNPQAAGVLATAVVEAWPDPHTRPLCVLGVLADKDAAGIVSALTPVVAGFVVTQPDSPRAMAAGTLAAIVEQQGGPVLGLEPETARAVSVARRLSGDAGVLVTGSLYTVGGVCSAIRAAGE